MDHGIPLRTVRAAEDKNWKELDTIVTEINGKIIIAETVQRYKYVSVLFPQKGNNYDDRPTASLTLHSRCGCIVHSNTVMICWVSKFIFNLKYV